jgi:hypothetical protein
LQTPSLGQKGTKNRIHPSFITPLTLPDSRARGLVVCGDGVVDVNKDTGIASLVRAREADERRRAAAATVVDLDLGAGDVELGAAGAAGAVEGDVLRAEQVLARGQGLGEGHGDLGLARGGPADGGGGCDRFFLVDLEPHVAAAVPGLGGLARGDFGHVELHGSRVRDAGDGCEGDGVACVHGGGLSAGSGSEGVAADGVGGDIGHGAWIGVSMDE